LKILRGINCHGYRLKVNRKTYCEIIIVDLGFLANYLLR